MRFSDLDGRSIGVWGAGIETRAFGRVLGSALPAARITVLVLEDASDPSELASDATVVGAARAVDHELPGHLADRSESHAHAGVAPRLGQRHLR